METASGTHRQLLGVLIKAETVELGKTAKYVIRCGDGTVLEKIDNVTGDVSKLPGCLVLVRVSSDNKTTISFIPSGLFPTRCLCYEIVDTSTGKVVEVFDLWEKHHAEARLKKLKMEHFFRYRLGTGQHLRL
jgi:hypothetical protein